MRVSTPCAYCKGEFNVIDPKYWACEGNGCKEKLMLCIGGPMNGLLSNWTVIKKDYTQFNNAGFAGRRKGKLIEHKSVYIWNEWVKI